ncbi:hypothetical protein KIPB_016754, partial [Kipferlia bialata]|eukprot:g16754.t1
MLLALVFIAQGKGCTLKDLELANFKQIPELFGAITYSFMMHHSIPNIMGPLNDHTKARSVFTTQSFTVVLVYIALSLSTIFAFGDIPNAVCIEGSGEPCAVQPMINLNFIFYTGKFLGPFSDYFLGLYPA